MIKQNMMQKIILGLSLLLVLISPVLQAETLDRIVAIVEDDVILESELMQEATSVARKLQANHVTLPPSNVLKRQILERMIVQKLQRQIAEKSGAQVSEEMLQNAIAEIARNNKMTPAQFRANLDKQGINYKQFAQSISNEIIVNQMRSREIGSRIKVTDNEINHYIETHSNLNDNDSYHLGHILIALPETASAKAIQKAKEQAVNIVAKLRKGQDFRELAMSSSDDEQALKGGDLGWRSAGEIPTLFADIVTKMQPGDIAEPIRSPSGFHIVKLLEAKGSLKMDEKHSTTKTKARHILIKTNEIINDDEAKKKLLALKQRLKDGDDFAVLARGNSDDKASALKGGDLGWVTPGALVPPFEEAMNRLAINQVSDPVQTQFGWHIIQVIEREKQDNSTEFKKSKVAEEIRRRKIEEETELWLRRLRDEAYVDINKDRL
jgi:peptidyl-prolyl cis-trans isomerase SurA